MDLSNRAETNLAFVNILAVGAIAAARNPYDSAADKGVINLGTAENKLMADVLVRKLNEPGVLTVSSDTLLYGSYRGSTELRSAIASLFNRKLGIVEEPLVADNVATSNGAGSMVNALSQILADAGDSIIIPSPVYGQFYGDVKNIGLINPIFVAGPASLPGIDLLEEAYQTAKQRGKPVRALLVTNPGNPTGRVVKQSTVRNYLWWAAEKGIHCIVDEVYAMSIWSRPDDPEYEEFESVLAMTDLPDPLSVHVIWSFSKDFAMSGMRAGVLVTRNERVINAYNEISYFYSIPRVVDDALTRILADTAFVDGFLQENKVRLRTAADKVMTLLETRSIPYLRPGAGIFIWIDLQKYSTALEKKATSSASSPNRSPIKSGTLQLFELFLESGVYITPEEAFFTDEARWFRIIFASPPEVVDVAFRRIFSVLDNIN